MKMGSISIREKLLFVTMAVVFNIAIAANDSSGKLSNDVVENNVASEQTIKLEDISVTNLSGDSVQITLKFSDLPRVPTGFLMDSPPELVFDFDDVINKLPREKLFQKLSLNLIKSISFANSGQKNRMVISLNNTVPFMSEVSGNNLVITIKNEAYKSTTKQEKDYIISALDFKRGDSGEGRLVLDIKPDFMNIDFKDNDSNEMQIEFKGATIASQLLRHFDVSDFGTPMKSITINKQEDNVIVKVIASGEYDKIAYQIGDKYIVETRPMTLMQQQLEKARKFKFTGEKISLNFQEIEIRAVLQLLADFTGLNIIANESVQGNVTLRLENIPWDQAMDFILKSKGLGKRESGNVILIAPNEELSKYEQLELASTKQLEALAQLKTEYIQVNYAKAEDVIKMIKGTDKTTSLLSDRGSITVDSRTNTLLIKDIEDKIVEVRELLKILDVPVKQVFIEAYIINCNENFTDSLGVKLNGAASAMLGSRRVGFGAGQSSAAASGSSSSSSSGSSSSTSGITINNNNSSSTAAAANTTTASSAQTAAGAAQGIIANPDLAAGVRQNTGQFFDLSTGGVAILGLALSRLPGGTILNMEIDAGEKEGITTTIARPKILTQDKQSASISSGVNIPYTTPGSTGYAGTTSFQSATLSLNVTPQITPNDQISMDLSISNDSPVTSGQSGSSSATPSISTSSLKTNVLIDNGETIVLGGIFKDGVDDSKTKIPFFSDIPFIGRLFQNKSISEGKTEMLIFITPRIVQNVDHNKKG